MADSAEIHKFSEMKSIQPYSTRDEYIYAMKEDLSEWFNSMYSTEISADNFIDKLENGVVICSHANNVTREALKTLKFNQNDLNQAGMINVPANAIVTHSTLNRVCLTPSGKSNWSGDYLLYKSDARPQSFQSRDNISNFIKWCRYIAKVRECLMFETDDLILRKNEKNVILCLLEVARFGSKFGIQVPTIIQLEQEIEAEIEREIEKSIVNQHKENKVFSADKHFEELNFENEQLISQKINNNLNKLNLTSENLDLMRPASLELLSLSNNNLKKNTISDECLDNSSLDGSFGIDQESNENRDFLIDSLENLSFTDEKGENNLENSIKDVKNKPKEKSLSVSYSSASLSSNFSNSFNQNEQTEHNITCLTLDESIPDKRKNKVVKNLDAFFRNESQIKDKFIESLNPINPINSINNSKTNTNSSQLADAIFDTIQKMNHSFKHGQDFNLNLSQTNLHNHVCSIADRCTCEKQFPVIKIGEGKYRIGNTKNIVFIRILRNHIMVRVGGGWDTLENYLNKHDPCRCINIGTKSKQNDNIFVTKDHSNCSSNILLTPVQSSSVNQINSTNRVPSSICQNIFPRSQSKVNCSSKKSCQSTNCVTVKKELDFTDAKLVVERDTQGKHIIGKIIINKTQEATNCNKLNKSFSNSSLNNFCSTNSKVLNDTANIEMNSLNRNMIIPLMHNENKDHNNSFTLCNENFSRTMIKSNIPTSNSLNSLNQNVTKNKIKNVLNQMPPKSPKNIHKPTNLISENQLVFLKNQPAILKLNSNDLSSNPTTTGYNSLNDDSSSDFLEQIFINPNNKIKPRLLKRYDKKRAITEAIVDLEKLNQTADANVDSNLNIQNNLISNNHKVTSSPKPPPRNKKKYRKSKTTEIGKFDLINKNSNFEPILNQQNEDSLDESDYESSEGLQAKQEKLNDSLESINLTINNDFRIEDDSLLFNNDNAISLSLSTTSSISNINEIDQENECLNLSQRMGRAQWDKTDQIIEYKTQLASPNNNDQYTNSNVKTYSCTSSSPRKDLTSTKKTNNLNLVKEQLYEMKKSIDATINFKYVQSYSKTICLTNRTTPRKVKKRSGERSITTGLHLKESESTSSSFHNNKNNVNNKLDSNNILSPIKCKNKSNGSMIPKYSPRIDLACSRQTSSSLHNLNNYSSHQTNRTRHDSTNKTNVENNNDISFSSVNTVPVEFKENKAYELRKKSLLLNKIIIKNHHDPIYSRSHPISTELTEQQVMNATLDNIQNLVAESTTRKRLFAKKNEKQFDPNLSIGSNGSSSFSSNSIPITTNFILKNKILASSPIINKQKLTNTLNTNSNTNVDRKKYSPVKIKQSSRSRSNNDLFYELERTNSAQDLIELINNCEPPVGDLTKYKVLLSECENYDPKIKKNKKNTNVRKENKSSTNSHIKTDKEKLNCTNDNNGAIDSNSTNKTHHKRSRSLPSYECIPLNHEKNHDLTYDEEFHEETYWQDIKTNF